MARHSLQRLSSPSPSFSLILHLLGIGVFGYCFRFLTLWDSPITQSYGWHFQYFTIIGLAASLLCFTLGALADITSSSTLFQLKNAVSTLATPVEMIVTMLYWGITAIDPKLVIPEDIALPLAPDLGFHVAPAVFLTLDLLFFSPPWTISIYGTLSLATTLAFAYWYWVELCFSNNGWYPYPLFAVLSTSQRVLLFAFSAGMLTASSGLLKWLYARVNGYEVVERAKKTQ
ncbi:hypothetical protein PT974_08908 [Cladobotryum mycophilum]|uniref:FAR-17a/AIG1-like protein n=1 Tax=Cladobotryum mycophilum TaxID=491253 RepID=A0ABR0SET3_9HYPO